MKKNYRLYTQVFFFALIALISLNHTLVERGAEIPFLSSASLHALCPYGGVETFVALITKGAYVQKIHESAVMLLTIIIITSILFGPVFCSYVCPLGTIQELISKIGKKINGEKFNTYVPRAIDKYLRFFRYFILFYTVYLSTKSLKLVFEAYDPYYALFNFYTTEVATTALIVLATVIIAALFIERPWCKYFCPFGALLGITNKFRIFKIKRNQSTCTNCNLCTKNCPMNIDVANLEVVKDHQCISCSECTSEVSCPVANTVTIESKKSKSLTRKIIGISIFVILLVGIGLAKATDNFSTVSSKVPRKYTSGEFEGAYDPADIRGSYTFGDITKSFDIEVDVLAEAFGIDKGNASEFKLKELETIYGDVGTGSVRQFVALYLALPYDGEAEAMPTRAIEILQERGVTVDLIKSEGIANEQSNYEGSEDEEHTESSINSTTTIKDAISLGISEEKLKEVLNSDLSNLNATIKEIAQANGLRFSDIKEELKSLIE